MESCLASIFIKAKPTEFELRISRVLWFKCLNENFYSLGLDRCVKLYCGIAVFGFVVISNDLEVIKAGWAKSFAPFPKGTYLIMTVP
ncbi:hypothetical protein HanOQP8_Chr00c040g0730151 [Helianthus annuus]|nr:hypothetical protein HanOQP8_Chr00c040g0730151 [Helianthus annuus]